MRKLRQTKKLVARKNERIGTMYIEGYMTAQREVKRTYPNDNLGWMKFPLREDLAWEDSEDEDEGGDRNDDEASAE
ncbi:hypothetical protein Dsin_022820 [Dipteronia sinensis]|uniref:Uncharacterized protein n=1 Tax=Dipteronia sinensis TaxID=43782 RepID=A0AAE0E038_9ROSI|nr:hypothetical protein Dsin_022820 [Dipteronia sinensis]